MKFLYVGLVVILAFATFLVTPPATERRDRHWDDDKNVILEIKRVHIAEAEYFSRYQRYGSLFELLGTGCLFGSDLAEGHYQAHIFLVLATPSGYTIRTLPARHTGKPFRSFFSDQTLAIRESLVTAECGSQLVPIKR